MSTEVVSGEPDFKSLVEGITFFKFGRMGAPHTKLIKLSADHRYLTWKGQLLSVKFGGECHGKNLTVNYSLISQSDTVDLQRATRVVRGLTSSRFLEVYGRDERTFTIFYDESGKERTLELMAPNPEKFKEAFNGLSAVVQKFQQQQC